MDDEIRGTRFQRIYVDSRFAVSGDSSDFTFQLKTDVVCARDQVCCVDQLQFPHSFWNVEPDSSDLLYIAEKNGAAAETYRIVQIEAGNHDGASVATALTSALNTNGKPAGFGTYSVTFNVRKAALTLALAGSGSFSIISDSRWQTLTAGSGVAWINGGLLSLASDNSINDLLRHTVDVDLATSWTTQTIDLLGGTCIYLHADFCTSSLGPNGETSILKSIPATVAYGYVLSAPQTILETDYVPLGQMTLRLFRTRLLDGKGRKVNLRGGTLSFSILLYRRAF
jgi:hypothetical protein